MPSLTIDVAAKRIQSVVNSQEAIETTSGWILHHKESAKVVADCWLNIFRAANDELRVALFYLMNDVVQRSKKKNIDSIATAFEPAAVSAAMIGRSSEKLRGVMERCMKLIEPCKAFGTQSVDKINRILADPSGDLEDTVAEIDNSELSKKIEAFTRSVQTVSTGLEIITGTTIDFERQIPSMKDRKDGTKLLRDAQNALAKMEEFREALSNNVRYTYEMIDTIEQARKQFNQQLRDVAFVEDAYVKFGQGIREVQEETEEMIRTETYPGGSPPRDAPSPSADEDPFAAGVEQVINAFHSRAAARDITDSADMEVEEDRGIPIPSHSSSASVAAAMGGSASFNAALEAARKAITAKAASASRPPVVVPNSNDPRMRQQSFQQPPAKEVASQPVPTIPTIPTIPQPVASNSWSAPSPAMGYSQPPPNYSMPPPSAPRYPPAAPAPAPQPPLYQHANVESLSIAPPPISPISLPPQPSSGGFSSVSPYARPTSTSYPPTMQPPAQYNTAQTYAGAVSSPWAAPQQPAQSAYGGHAQQHPQQSYMPSVTPSKTAAVEGDYRPRTISLDQQPSQSRPSGEYEYYRQSSEGSGPPTPYTPSAPGLLGRKDSGGPYGHPSTPTRGAYGGGGGGESRSYGNYGGGNAYGNSTQASAAGYNTQSSMESEEYDPAGGRRYSSGGYQPGGGNTWRGNNQQGGGRGFGRGGGGYGGGRGGGGQNYGGRGRGGGGYGNRGGYGGGQQGFRGGY